MKITDLTKNLNYDEKERLRTNILIVLLFLHTSELKSVASQIYTMSQEQYIEMVKEETFRAIEQGIAPKLAPDFAMAVDPFERTTYLSVILNDESVQMKIGLTGINGPEKEEIINLLTWLAISSVRQAYMLVEHHSSLKPLKVREERQQLLNKLQMDEKQLSKAIRALIKNNKDEVFKFIYNKQPIGLTIYLGNNE